MFLQFLKYAIITQNIEFSQQQTIYSSNANGVIATQKKSGKCDTIGI